MKLVPLGKVIPGILKWICCIEFNNNNNNHKWNKMCIGSVFKHGQLAFVNVVKPMLVVGYIAL